MAIHSEDLPSNNNLGTLLAQEGKRSEAIEYYERALAIDPNAAETHNNLGSVLASEGRQREAIEQFELAVKLKPSIVVYRNLVLAYVKAGRQRDAAAVARRALELTRSQNNRAAAREIEAWLKAQSPEH